MATNPFIDRRDAGRQLAARLQHLKDTDVWVLALPRGGVPVALELARALNAPMHLLLVRKLGAPFSAELAIGAVVDGNPVQVVLNDGLIAHLNVSEEYIQQEIARQSAELERRRTAFAHGMRAPDVFNQHILLVDDGVATGSTMLAAIRGMRAGLARRITVAVPVASPDAARELAELVDEWVCLREPASFHAVGDYYRDFRQYEDVDIVNMLSADAGDELA